MLTPLKLVIIVEILGVAGMILGFLPRETALFLLGIFAYFALFAPLKQAVLFAVFSIPLYTALPITESFDTMAGWRIIILVLFSRVLWPRIETFFSPRKGETFSTPLSYRADSPLKSRKRSLSLLSKLTIIFFAVSTMSLLVAPEPSFGIRKLLFLANIFFLFFVIQWVIKSKQDWLDVSRYTFTGALITLFIGYAQLISVFFVSLHNFWLWWVSHVIPVFYGSQLKHLLSHSNTWFSYYENAEPTLRIFSFFPDSHSFALAMVLLLPMALTYYFARKQTKKSVAGLETVIVLALLAIIFSGTRGVWVGVAPIFMIVTAAYFALKKFLPLNKLSAVPVTKTCVFVFLIFALLFPVASQIQKIAQIRQGGRVSDSATFSRISTSFSAEELSNKGRIQIWKSTLQSIAKHPFLGVGIGNYPVVLSENVSATKKGASAHSLYLDFIAEIGILGGVVVLLILFEILRKAIRVFTESKDLFFTAFAGFFAIFLLWVMAYSAVDVVLLNDKVLLLFTAIVALLYAIPKIGSSEAYK